MIFPPYTIRLNLCVLIVTVNVLDSGLVLVVVFRDAVDDGSFPVGSTHDHGTDAGSIVAGLLHIITDAVAVKLLVSLYLPEVATG